MENESVTYDKLIRDKIPNKLIKKGLKFDAISIFNDQAETIWEYVLKKLDEEIEELKQEIDRTRLPQNNEKIGYELDDVYDVMSLIEKLSGHNRANEKATYNGGFNDLIVLKNVEG